VGTRDGWARVPIGDGSEPYVSIRFVRTVLVVARTVTTTVWLLDFLGEMFGDDHRVQVLFTVEDDRPSVYHQAARDLLREIGAAVVPWPQACATRFDLAICSTHTGSLERLRSPLFITPHGPGFGKPASVRPGGEVPVPLDACPGRASSTTVVLSHSNQAELFASRSSNVRLLVAGDPAYDRLCASTRHASRYRAAFGLRQGQRLAVLASTWGPGAQLGALPDLAIRLREELGVDEWRVAMIIHPNIWFGHGPWQVRTWLRTAREAGVLLVPPRGDEWRAAIVAADVVIADHGSVGFYAAAIGRPVLRASFGDEYLEADAPLAELGRLAPEVDLSKPLASQLLCTVTDHDPERYVGAVDRMFARGGAAVQIMRDAAYEIIGLDPPFVPARVLAVGVPELDVPVATAHVVTGDVDGATDPSRVTIALTRRPAVLGYNPDPPAGLGGGGGRHLVVDDAEPHVAMLESAAIITREQLAASGTPAMLVSWAASRLEEYPGCRFVATIDREAGRVCIATRDGRELWGRWLAPIPPGAAPELAVLASSAYLLDVAGQIERNSAMDVVVRLGTLEHTARLTSVE
jgi:hypothetical protein